MANFESVAEYGVTWEPKQKKEGDVKTSLTATDKSWLQGYFLESREGQGKDKNSTVHVVQMQEVGDPAHLPEGVKPGDKVSVWGTGILNNKIMEHIKPGEYVNLVWLGIQQPKKAGGRPYHGWDVQKATDVEPLTGHGASFSADNTEAKAEPAVAAPASAAMPDAEGESDLPF